VEDDLRRGTVFFDLHRSDPGLLDVFAGSIKDGRGNTLHRSLFVVETSSTGEMTVRMPTVFQDVTPAPKSTTAPSVSFPVPDRQSVERYLYSQTLQPSLSDTAKDREKSISMVAKHVEISLNALIDRQQIQLGEFLNRQVEGQTITGLDGLIAQAEQHLDELNNRLESRRLELEMERHCTISDITHIGRAWLIPHPERTNPKIAPMVRDEQIEKIAIECARKFEESRGWEVESVESENRGFDLISRRAHPEDPKTFVQVRFIEVKGRAGVGEIALTANEFRAAERLKGDYWLYAAFNCSTKADLHTVQNPARLGWQPIVKVEHYSVPANQILEAQSE